VGVGERVARKRDTRGTPCRPRIAQLLPVLLSLVALSSCMHDEFPGRVKKGCTSEQDCGELLAEAVRRLNDCTGYLTGNRLRHDPRRIRSVCSYEMRDVDLALARAREWARRAHSPARFWVVWR
jgi:hypothetical protein